MDLASPYCPPRTLFCEHKEEFTQRFVASSNNIADVKQFIALTVKVSYFYIVLIFHTSNTMIRQIGQTRWIRLTKMTHRFISLEECRAKNAQDTKHQSLSSNFYRKLPNKFFIRNSHASFAGRPGVLTIVVPAGVGHHEAPLGVAQLQPKKALVQAQAVYPGYRSTWIRAYPRAPVQDVYVLACVRENRRRRERPRLSPAAGPRPPRPAPCRPPFHR